MAISSPAYGLPVTSLYAGVLGVAFALTSLRVGLTRSNTGEMYGAKSDTKLDHLVRSAGTIGELGFPFLILLGLIEFQSIIGHSLLWWFGLIFTTARILHSLQLGAPSTLPVQFRMFSFLTTVASLVLASLILLFGSAKAY